MNDRWKVLDLFEKQKEMVDKRVSEGVDKYRKGDLEITLIDQQGNAIPNVKISVKQKNHEFRFGANIFMLDQFETEEKNKLYEKYFCDVFNMATLPFYWNSTEPEKGKLRYEKGCEYMYRRPPIDLCIEFCAKHGIEPREHALAYEPTFPKWIHNEPKEVVKKELERRYQEISSRYADKIPCIEVTNEMLWWKGKTPFYDDPEYVEWCFKLAEKYFPNNVLSINEFQGAVWCNATRSNCPYYAYIEKAINNGARIDAIGMQFHIFTDRENEYDWTRRLLEPENLFKKMDLYSQFNKPLQITEVTLPALSWESEDEEFQAELLEKLYSVWFSHPNMEQIIYWNLVDGYAATAAKTREECVKEMGNMTIGENVYYGGLIRFDMTPKPAYYRLKNLIEKVWNTSVVGQTNAQGEYKTRGFYGKYDIEITVDGKTICKTVQHSKKGDGKFIIQI